jgi:hypothetical protein
LFEKREGDATTSSVEWMDSQLNLVVDYLNTKLLSPLHSKQLHSIQDTINKDMTLLQPDTIQYNRRCQDTTLTTLLPSPHTAHIESNGIDQGFAQYMIRKRIDPSKFTQLEEYVVANCNIQERVHQKEFEDCLVHTDIRFAFDISRNVAQNIKNKTRSHIYNYKWVHKVCELHW